MSILNKLEIDVMQTSELKEASELAVKHHLPALIIHPGLASDGLAARGRVRGRFKIITPVDWPKGENFGMNKMQGLSIDALEADGFEILLTPSKTEIETRNEAKAITEFIRQHVSPTVEIRFVLGTHTRENIDVLAKGLTKIPTPTFVRNDIHLKVQISKANPEIHNETMKKIAEHVRLPMKICGNINDIRTMAACENVGRFGVNLLQAKTIIKEFKQQPDSLREILN